MKIDLYDMMRRAFNEGFRCSGEGCNGEYPFNENEHRIDRELAPEREQAIKRIMREAHVGVSGK